MRPGIATSTLVLTVLLGRGVTAEWMTDQERLVEDVSLSLQRIAHGTINVQLGRPAPQVKGATTPWANVVTGVWLLRRDGTSVKRRKELFGESAWCNAGFCNWVRSYAFDATLPNELAGVAVIIDGKLYVRDLHATP